MAARDLFRAPLAGVALAAAGVFSWAGVYPEHSPMTPSSRATRFEGLLDLARLPYFEVRQGRLVLADSSLGPMLDAHTHLALSYGPGRGVDLERDSGPARHYLPAPRSLDLEVYANQNLSSQDLSAMKRDLTLRSLTPGGLRASHTLPALRREMDELGIERAVLLPIDLPMLSHNAERWLRATQGDSRFECFGSVHPWAPRPDRGLGRQLALGARGLKLHPGVQLARPDAKRVRRLLRLCGQRRMIVLFHCGPVGIEPRLSRALSQVRHYQRPIAENPDLTFVLGHSGALQMPLALELARRFANVYLELSSQPLEGVRRILGEAPSERILFGSDWPFYHQALALSKVFLATEGSPALRRAVLHDNGARLLSGRA